MDLQGLNVNRSTASLTSNKDSSVTNSAPSSSIVIVRQSSLMTMFAFVKLKGGNYLTGPAWVSHRIDFLVMSLPWDFISQI